HKTWVHEGGISSPLIVNWPKGIRRAGELNNTAAHMIDIVPTVMELAGLTVPDSWNGEQRPPAPGKSLVPTFSADTSIQRDCLWWLHEGNRAVRVGDWKLVAAKNDPWELYNIASDRAEQINLASQHPDKARELEAVWKSQTDAFTALAAKTRPEQAPGKQKKKQQ
ncbi:MAG: sulfatase/phosphatase domain-containing protein, partial [Planctomyces sp.]